MTDQAAGSPAPRSPTPAGATKPKPKTDPVQEAHRLPTQDLVGLVWDDDPRLRAEAARLIGVRGVPTTSLYLHELLEDPEVEVRTSALEALIRIPGPGRRQALGIMATDPDPGIADRARVAREGPPPPPPEPGVDPPRSVPDPTRPLDPADLTSSDPEVRRRTAWGLAERRRPDAVRQLQESIEDPDSHVRTACALALGKLRAGLAELVFALRDDHQVVRLAATAALASLDEDKVYEEMWEAAMTWVPGSPALLDVFEALEADMSILLAEWLDHPFAGVRGVALDWIESRGGEDDLALVEVLFDDEVEWLAAQARDLLDERD